MSDEERERTLELDRVANFSDAVFAIAATLLVVTIQFPRELSAPNLDAQVWREYREALPQMLAYGLSFFVIARYWLAHHRLFKVILRIDGRFVALNLVMLGFIALLPFPTEVFGENPTSSAALIVYAATITATGLASTAVSWYAAEGNRLIDASTRRDWVVHGRLRGLSIPAVFLVSIPIAFLSVPAAQATWALLVPLRFLFTRRYGKITEVW